MADGGQTTKCQESSARIAVFLRAVAVRGPCDKERRSPHKSPSVKVKLEISSLAYGGRTLKNGARPYFVHGAAASVTSLNNMQVSRSLTSLNSDACLPAAAVALKGCRFNKCVYL